MGVMSFAVVTVAASAVLMGLWMGGAGHSILAVHTASLANLGGTVLLSAIAAVCLWLCFRLVAQLIFNWMLSYVVWRHCGDVFGVDARTSF